MQRDTVLEILNESRIFFAELDFDSMSNGLDPMAMMLPDGQTLEDLFNKDEYEEISAVLLARLGPMALIANRMKPAAVAALLMFGDSEESATASAVTIDQFLWERAGTAGITSRGLELIEEQLSVLDKMPPKFLLEAVRAEEGVDVVLDELVRAYSSEDLETIANMVDSLSSVESFMATLNDERNIRMVKRLQPDLDQGSAFIAVGSAHLAGPHGLLKILREQGYEVEPVLGGKRTQWLNVPIPGDTR